MKKALITGITGQDGAYLAEFLLKKGYEVHGIQRRASSPNTDRIAHLLEGSQDVGQRVHLHFGDLTDASNLINVVERVQPDEIYNLGAQSHVGISFAEPEYTANVDGLGTVRLLEAMRITGLAHHCRFYQASTSELYGLVQETPQRESTPFYPRSPYAVAKLYAYWITVNYRESYGMYACNGVLFNHESPLRGEEFVTRKITRSLARIALGLQRTLDLGNLAALRDWGHAADYVEMQWLMLQQPKAKDFVIATGQQHSVRDFVRMAAAHLGITLQFEGTGAQEIGVVTRANNPEIRCKVGDVIVRVDEQFFRPAEVDALLGDPTRAKQELGWSPKISLENLVKEMMTADFALAQRDQALIAQGMRLPGRAQ